ncbi:MAG: hypothetical protein IT356_11060 [Gemmatimonadaceae bacterium]|nr:hypothetical protein [Gemmatimonadaceae bacterium]
MDALQVALVVLLALLVGMLAPVLVQLYLALRQMREALTDTKAHLDPVLRKIEGAANLSTALAVAVTAGVRAYRESAGAAHGRNVNEEKEA